MNIYAFEDFRKNLTRLDYELLVRLRDLFKGEGEDFSDEKLLVDLEIERRCKDAL